MGPSGLDANQTFGENVENLRAFLDVSQAYNPDINVVGTVSLVPSMANAHSKEVADSFCAAN